ncbi:MAG: Wzz/FepE/Etk N-terminal domain-containing protein [Candidatus Binataceae bacterium]
MERGEKRAESYDLSDQIDLSEYLFAIAHRWWLIVVTILLTMAATFVVTKFVMKPWYRAEAIIRPVGQNAILQETTGGMMGGIGGSSIGGLAAGILGTATGNDAEEYMPILTSFAFTNVLVKQHQLMGHLLAEEGTPLNKLTEDPDWVVYRILQRRFECHFAISTGNLTLFYRDQNRSQAERILGFYIDDLREKLRSRQVRDAIAAVASLQEEARQSSDALIRDQLYELIARQVQRQKLAQVQADFAFIELEPPTSPDRRYKPVVWLDCVIMGLLSAIGAIVWILVVGGDAGGISLSSLRYVVDSEQDATQGTAQKALR